MTHPNYEFPSDWILSSNFVPEQHFMNLPRFDKRTGKTIPQNYMTVQNRMIWFLRDQRRFIATGNFRQPYIILTELVEHDTERQWANFKTFIRDVLGNEVTMYGSESAKDFPDYLEKASTKSLGRALVMLGYGTQFADDDLYEGDRIVDSPIPAKAAEPVL